MSMKRPAMLNIDLDVAMYKLEQVRDDIDRYGLNETREAWEAFDNMLAEMIDKCDEMKTEDVGDDW